MQLTYLASPYTHPDPQVMQARYDSARTCINQMLMQGDHVFSPIVHGHPIAALGNLPHDFNWWQDRCLDWLERCDTLAVLVIDGWEESCGLQAEIRAALTDHMPIRYVSETGFAIPTPTPFAHNQNCDA